MKLLIRLKTYLKTHYLKKIVASEEDFEITEFDMIPYIDCYLKQDQH